MAAPPREPPALPEDLVEDVLLRIQPEDPSRILRASLVCKPWGRAASLPGFLRRLHARHGAVPVLGFLHDSGEPRFVHTTASPFSLPAPDRGSWRALDCRHGRALFISWPGGCLPGPPRLGPDHRRPAALTRDFSNAAVVCAAAADGCDHRDCHGGPFRVAFVSSDSTAWATSACVYSSDTGTWGEVTTLGGTSLDFKQPGVLVRNSLLYLVSEWGFILEYNLAGHGLDLVESPGAPYPKRIVLMPAENGGLGAAEALEASLCLWSREPMDGGDVQWVHSRVINIDNLLPVGATVSSDTALKVMGFADGANTIFVSRVAGLFTVKLQSERVRKVCEDRDFHLLIPIVSFYTPGWTLRMPQGEHHDLPPSNASEEGGRQEEKTLERAQELFHKGSKAIKEGDFVFAVDCLSHALEIMVVLYGKFAPECAGTYYKYGCALLHKAQEVAVPLGNVPRSAPNEEPAKMIPETQRQLVATMKMLHLSRNMILKKAMKMILIWVWPGKCWILQEQ